MKVILGVTSSCLLFIPTNRISFQDLIGINGYLIQINFAHFINSVFCFHEFSSSSVIDRK